jgi:hypothetical protein
VADGDLAEVCSLSLLWASLCLGLEAIMFCISCHKLKNKGAMNFDSQVFCGMPILPWLIPANPGAISPSKSYWDSAAAKPQLLLPML